LKPKEISKLTAIPYETVCQWKYQKALSTGFHNLAVTVPVETQSSKNLSVTVKSPGRAKVRTFSNATVTVTTPDGYLIEGLPANFVVDLLRAARVVG
ncbi:hypothetical protein H0W26_01125, partial [Candidatus Dependentiae bacterium]|nr:hypothetical protein [Candidatus Dependentiae bacterium]